MGSQLWSAEDLPKRLWPFWSYGQNQTLVFESLESLVKYSPKIADDLFPDVYSGLIYALSRMGYIRNQNFWVFSYDWTQSNEISAQKLNKLVRKITAGGNEHVDVIAHSMGGIVARAAMAIFQAPIRRTVYIATPHYGSAAAYTALHPDHDVDMFKNWGWRSVVANHLWKKNVPKAGGKNRMADQLKWVGRQLQSLYELLPDQWYITAQHPLLFHEFGEIYQHPSFRKREPMLDVESTYFSDETGFKFQEDMDRIRSAMDFKKRLGGHLPGTFLTIFSESEATVWSHVYTEIDMSSDEEARMRGYTLDDDKFWSCRLRDKGDGVVSSFSAVAESTNPVAITGSHLSLPNYAQAHEEIRAFLKGPLTA
ncbi:MAG: alpha/beta hydrolase [Deltaproteobacteria bacterium]|nr:alpha/beta hydrolase [Deltaproteobacteria bacterium]